MLLLNVFRRDVLCPTLSNRNDFYVRGRRYKSGEVTYIRMHSFLFWLIIEKIRMNDGVFVWLLFSLP